jgi:hypothetical protein
MPAAAAPVQVPANGVATMEAVARGDAPGTQKVDKDYLFHHVHDYRESADGR